MSDAGYLGPRSQYTEATDYAAMAFVVERILSRIATTTPVKVIAVHGGGVAPVGTVDVQPMVAQQDGQGNATAHGVIYGLPYVRIQGGTNAVIIDPVVGDMGWAGFCSSDISSAVANRAPANPGSRRQFDWADGLYLGGVLNAAPTQYVQFASGQINIVAPTVAVTGNLTVTGTITAQGEVTGAGKHLSTHTHGGVTTGSGNTGAPN